MKVCVTNPPAFVKCADDGSGSTGVFVCIFDVADTVCFSCQLLHTYKEGTDIILTICWSFMGATDECAVKWEFEYTISNPTCEFRRDRFPTKERSEGPVRLHISLI